MNTLACREDARKMIGGEGPTVSRLYRIPGVDWLVAGQEQFSSATTLRFVDLNGLSQDNTFGPLNTRSLTDVRRRARELTSPARKGKFLAENRPNNKHHKVYRQFAKPTGLVNIRETIPSDLGGRGRQEICRADGTSR